MPALFFYGTLRHLPLLETVIGRSLDHLTLTKAALPDHQIYWAKGQAFPLILPEPGADAVGLLADGLDAEDVARLDYYERVFGYDLRWVDLLIAGQVRSVQMFWPPETSYQPGPFFDLADWALSWGAINCRAAREVMGYRALKTPEQVGQIYGNLHARAASFVAAQAEAPILGPSGKSRSDVTTTNLRRPYANFFAMEERDLRFTRFDGAESPEIERAAFLGTDAALVLPYDPVRDRVLLVEQFRMGPFARGDHGPWQLEPIAGRVDPGETPADCARREAIEEAGLELTALEPVHQGYPSPGSVTEFYHVFLGLTDLPDGAAGIGGVAGEAEDIKGHLFSFDAAMAMLDRGEIRVTPLALCLLWLARNRDRLRASA